MNKDKFIHLLKEASKIFLVLLLFYSVIIGVNDLLLEIGLERHCEDWEEEECGGGYVTWWTLLLLIALWGWCYDLGKKEEK